VRRSGSLTPLKNPRLYAPFTRFDLISNGAFTRACRRLPETGVRRPNMLDLIYVALGLAVFAIFALGVRAAERM
jgi:hypothetical protein